MPMKTTSTRGLLALACLAVAAAGLVWMWPRGPGVTSPPEAAQRAAPEGSTAETASLPTPDAERVAASNSPPSPPPPDTAASEATLDAHEGRFWIVRGSVGDGDGGLEGAQVRVQLDSTLRATTTDGQGRYELQLPRPDPAGNESNQFAVFAGLRGFRASLPTTAWGDRASGIVELDPIRLYPGSTIRGRAIHRSDASPCPYATVVVQASGQQGGGGFGLCWTDANGVFEVGTAKPLGTQLQVVIDAPSLGTATSSPFTLDSSFVEIGDVLVFGEAEVGATLTSTQPGVSFAGLLVEVRAGADEGRETAEQDASGSGASISTCVVDDAGSFLARDLARADRYTVAVEGLLQTGEARIPPLAARVGQTVSLPCVRIDVELPEGLVARDPAPTLRWTWLGPSGPRPVWSPAARRALWRLVEVDSRWRVDALDAETAVLATVVRTARTSESWMLAPVDKSSERRSDDNGR
jgi:hypothetical protein